MKIALTVWEDRISPVFDVATKIAIYDHSGNEICKEIELDFLNLSAFEKVIELAKMNTWIIICGAVSKQVRCLAESCGIVIYSFITGREDVVIKAYSSGLITDERFKMPGCSRSKEMCCKEAVEK